MANVRILQNAENGPCADIYAIASPFHNSCTTSSNKNEGRVRRATTEEELSEVKLESFQIEAFLTLRPPKSRPEPSRIQF